MARVFDAWRMTALANRVLVTLQTVRAPQRNPRVDRHRRVVDFLGQPLDGEANGQQDVKQLRVLWLEDATLAEAQKEGEQVVDPLPVARLNVVGRKRL